MKIKLLAIALLFLTSIQVKAQVGADTDDLIVVAPGLITINGTLTLSKKEIYITPTDCKYASKGKYLLLKNDESAKLIKKWSKKLAKNSSSISEVVIKGMITAEGVDPKSIKEALKRPEKLSGGSANDAYVTACFDKLDAMKQIVKDSRYLTSETKEVKDATTGGMVTEITYYDENCKVVDATEALKMKNVTLKNIGKAIASATALLVANAELSALLNAANKETVTGMGAITAAANKLKGIAAQTLMNVELKNLIANLRKTKAEIELLKQ